MSSRQFQKIARFGGSDRRFDRENGYVKHSYLSYLRSKPMNDTNIFTQIPDPDLGWRSSEPSLKPNEYYWQLGLTYLLQGQDIEAQICWSTPCEEADSEAEIIELTADLFDYLDRINQQKYVGSDWVDTLVISDCLRELEPKHLPTIFRSIVASSELGEFSFELLSEWQLSAALDSFSDPDLELDRNLVKQAIYKILENGNISSIPILIQIISTYEYFNKDIIESIISHCSTIWNIFKHEIFTVQLLTAIEPIAQSKIAIQQNLAQYSSRRGLHQQAIEAAQRFYNSCIELSLDPSYQIFSNYYILITTLSAGKWGDVKEIVDRQQQLFDLAIDERPEKLGLAGIAWPVQATMILPYLNDRARENRRIHNQIARICTERVNLAPVAVEPIELAKPAGVLRIGYIGMSLNNHSVGSLCRWLWKYHNHEKFQIFTYAVAQNPQDPTYQRFFAAESDVSYPMGVDPSQIVAQIRADDIDILIDLDSVTFDVTCQVMAAKPAPIQVTWLGWDASGIPTIDYYIADDLVLPDNAQEYYQEKIWRLPGSYLAVDGFDVGIPTLKRADLDIPDDAVIYWSGQAGFKRHPDTIRLQLEILKRVPHSFLLIKGKSDRQVITDLFGNLAQEIGVDPHRLRFIPDWKEQETYRANLGIADVVLDTFPYNGATTTLETLWMGIPLVTKVGEQFSARNSYTFMKHAGLDEGIAWSDEEYINWGVKLGLDPDLRAEIKTKLRSARHTSDLWNGEQFTRQMEDAYQQMWKFHLEKN